MSPLLRASLHALPDTTADFASPPATVEVQQVFTDGSCFLPDLPEFSLAGWGVVCASSGSVISCGLLPGAQQSIPRAELTAMLSAARWVAQPGVSAIVWSDASQVVRGVEAILTGSFDSGRGANQDLWQQVEDVLASLAHLSPSACDNPFEEWLAANNQWADTVAVTANANRPHAQFELHRQALAYYEANRRRLRALRAIYFGIAQESMTSRTGHVDAPEPEVLVVDEMLSSAPLDVSLADQLPLNWRAIVDTIRDSVPSIFRQSIVDFLIRQDEEHGTAYHVTWVELTAIILEADSIHFPVHCPCTGRWSDSGQVAFSTERLTLAAQLRLVRQAVVPVLKACSVQGLSFSNFSLLELGFVRPCDGLLLVVDEFILCSARAKLRDFATRRPVRGSADMARPLRF